MLWNNVMGLSSCLFGLILNSNNFLYHKIRQKNRCKSYRYALAKDSLSLRIRLMHIKVLCQIVFCNRLIYSVGFVTA